MRRSVLTLMLAATALAATSCATGLRPYFEDTPTVVGTTTGDPAIDAVLGLYDQVDFVTFTASYDVQLLFGGVTTAASVTQSTSPSGREVTIGTVRFTTDASGTRTCRLDAGTCAEGIDAAAVSNTGVTPEFAFGDMAKRLRRDAASRVGAGVPSTIDVAGLTATCVDVPVAGGTKQYCSLADGVLAKFVGADVLIDLTEYRPEATPLSAG
jgi:hypothetical protein